MDNMYLIPANSKRSILYFGLFNMTDLIIVGSGSLVTLTLIFINSGNNSLKAALISIAPLLICAFLVIPLPYQHNIRTFIKNVYIYFTRRRTYYWKGWCINSGEEDSAE